MADPIVSALREAATHRGHRLVASRRRKAGTGDFGKFGLTDPKGKPVLGIGDDGLTASAEDIESFLRGGERDTWTKSAAITPAPPKRAKPAVASPQEPAPAAPSTTTNRAIRAGPTRSAISIRTRRSTASGNIGAAASNATPAFASIICSSIRRRPGCSRRPTSTAAHAAGRRRAIMPRCGSNSASPGTGEAARLPTDTAQSGTTPDAA